MQISYCSVLDCIGDTEMSKTKATELNRSQASREDPGETQRGQFKTKSKDGACSPGTRVQAQCGGSISCLIIISQVPRVCQELLFLVPGIKIMSGVSALYICEIYSAGS